MLAPDYWGHATVGNYGESGVPHGTQVTLSPAEAWERFAHLIAGRPRMRLAETRTRRLEYPRRRELPLSPTVPSKPAAVPVYDNSGFTCMIPLDLDAHDCTEEQVHAVDRDTAGLTALLDGAGCEYLVDHAHGGRHLYVLLEQPVSADDVRTLVTAMAARFATLDPSPVRSASDGLITVPGSPHVRGGHRQLSSDETTLRRIESGHRSPASAIRKLHVELAPEIRDLVAHDGRLAEQRREDRRAAGALDTLSPIDELVLVERFAGRSMSPKLAQLARDGDWRSHGYPSASEARGAVIMSAIAIGMTREDIRARMSDGRLPGLRSLFSHKGLHRLSDEYNRALSALARREKSDKSHSPTHADRSDTSAHTHTGGGGRATPDPGVDPHGYVRCWRSLVHFHSPGEYLGSTGWKYQQVLRALAMNAHMRGTPETASGVRWIAVATGYSEETVALALRDLSNQDDPWIVRTRQSQGILANEYRLRIPDRHRDHAERIRWVRGAAHAIRPAFVVLGTPAALVYEAVEQGYAASYRQLAERTGLCRDAVREAVSILASWELIAGSPTEGWDLTSSEADLDRLAERLGATTARAARVQRHRAERARYREMLEESRQLPRARRSCRTRFLRDLEDMPPDVQELLDWMRRQEAG